MLPTTDEFSFDHEGTELVYGRGRIERLGERLAERGLDRALVVCGSNVGANDDLMDPVRRGLGDRLVSVFDGTTPGKRAETGYRGVEAMERHEADVLVGIGGGSSIDVARFMSVLATDRRSIDDMQAEGEREGTVRPVQGGERVVPVVAVPTTFAGADFSRGGSLVVSTTDEPPVGEVIRVGIGDERAAPVEVCYDPDLFETTPDGPLHGSAMNGFNKGLETVYGSSNSPITDGTAVRGLQFLREGLPRLDDGDGMGRAVIGTMLVQFERETNVIHAFGHGFSRRYPVQQGRIHGIVVPHVLRHVLETVDARRRVLARGLGIDAADRSEAELTEGIVDEVVAVRDALDVPRRLRELDPVDRDDFPAIAEFIRSDSPMERTPPGYDPSVEEIESLLYETW